jgi:hypothetical protein
MSSEPKVVVVNIPTNKTEQIIEEQNKQARKTHIMRAELTTIQPSTILFNAISVAATELARLQRLSVSNGLSMSEAKKYEIMFNAMLKLSAESRLVKQQSLLEGKSDAEVIAIVQEALEVISNE